MDTMSLGRMSGCCPFFGGLNRSLCVNSPSPRHLGEGEFFVWHSSGLIMSWSFLFVFAKADEGYGINGRLSKPFMLASVSPPRPLPSLSRRIKQRSCNVQVWYERSERRRKDES